MKIRCVLLDDQTMFLQLLVAMIRNFPGLEVIGSFARVTPALDRKSVV
jgi:DNA-binding NarL/FixJ family response regulator